MKKIHIVEFEWQVESAISAVRTGDGIAIVTNPMSYFKLKRAEVPFESISDFYQMKDFWSLYKESLEKVDYLVDILDKTLLRTDTRFSSENLRPFKYLGYPLKINLDQIICYLFQIKQILKKYNVSQFVVAHGPELIFDNMGLLSSTDSVIGNILQKKVSVIQ